MTLKSAQIPDTSMFAWSISQRVLILPFYVTSLTTQWHYAQREFTHTEIITFTSVNFLDQAVSSSNATLTVVSELSITWCS